MQISKYEKLAMRTNDGNTLLRLCDAVAGGDGLNSYDVGELINGALGLTGEAGEVADLVKKIVFHGHEYDQNAIIKEIGDVGWYMALLAHAIGVDLDTILARNVEKLRKRYPDGFSSEASINRVV